MRLHLCAHVLITTAAESSYNMLCDISVTMQALVQITAARKKCSEAAVWEACMNSLRSAAAALECAVTSLVKAAAGREVPPNVAHACCMAVDGLLGAADPQLGIEGEPAGNFAWHQPAVDALLCCHVRRGS